MAEEQQASNHRGKNHVDLEGAPGAFRFRSERVAAGKLKAEVDFQFVYEGVQFGPLPVLDLSVTGLGLRPVAVYLPQGALLEDATVSYRGAVVWKGTASVVYQVDGQSPRLGVRFMTGVLDLERIHVRDSLTRGGLGRQLEKLSRAQAELPVEYRAAIHDAAQLLVRVRQVLIELESEQADRPSDTQPNEAEVLEAVHESWAPHYYERLGELHEMARDLSEAQLELSKDYATQALLPLLRACPMHRRAYEKPFGYAGDYALMRLYFAEESRADTMFGRLLHYTAQRYTLGRTVVAREANMRANVRELLSAPGHHRIVSLACGPSIELMNVLRELPELPGTAELILVDQDEAALAFCHRELNALLAQHRSGRNVELKLLHFSVRQLLKPRNSAEQGGLDNTLANVDLVYSAGLFDYLPNPVARQLIHVLYGLLRSGGRLFVGNLREAPDTTWIMENVLSWHLEYRERRDLLGLAATLEPKPVTTRVVEDNTRHCLFLEVAKA